MREGLELAFWAAGVAMARLELDGRIRDANAAFAHLLGRDADDLGGRALLDFVAERDASAVRGGRLTSFRDGTIRADLHCVRADGREVPVRISISLARDGKGSPAFLVASLEDVTDLKAAASELRREALYDPETDMPRERLLEDRLAVALRSAQRHGTEVLVGVVRIRPDANLVTTAERLAGLVRESDTVARVGRSEFALVMPGATRAAFERCLPVDAVESAGAASFPADGSDAATLLAAAELAATPRASAMPAFEELDQAAASADAAARLRALEPVSLFLSVPDQVLRRIARYTSRQTAVAGEELLIGPGRPSLRIVEEGVFEVIPEGHEVAVMTIAESDFFGTEAPGHPSGPLTVRLRALTDTKLLVLEDEALERVAPAGSQLRASIGDAVSRRAEQLRHLAQRGAAGAGSGQVVTVYSTKGGAGRTTIALNLAAELGARHPGEVLLLDLALPYNHAALLANLVPTTCLARLHGLDAWALPGALRGALVGHPDGFMVLPAALRPEESELVSAELVAAALEHLSPHFRHIVVDLGLALTDEAIAIMERSHRLIVVVTPELTTMHDTRYLVDLATRVLHVPSASIDVVLNHRAPHSAMDARGVEQVLGRPLAAEFRYLGARPESAGLAGALLVRQPQLTPFARSVRDLADRLAEPVQTQTA